jgi:long-chain acyl-CoA synthetase
VIFLTGATGFVGMEVLARLLEQPEAEVLCLVRAPDQAAADRRLDEVLAVLWNDPGRYRARVHALCGDLTAPGLGLGAADRARAVAETHAICHCAASIAFDLPLADARQINVEGTRGVLELAHDVAARGRLERLVHVSTAYIAGTRPGTFAEDMLDAGQAFRNTYEQTKWEAEHLLLDRAGDLPLAIARPSIVVGESDSGWTPAFNVLYWPLRAFARGLFEQVPALPEGRVDVVPVDYVADGIVALLGCADPGRFALVSGHAAATVQALSELACAYFDKPRPPFVTPGAFGGTTADQHGAVYLPYFDMQVEFDDTRTRTLLGMSAPPLARYFPALMDYADTTRWGKRGCTREDARERAALAPH